VSIVIDRVLPILEMLWYNLLLRDVNPFLVPYRLENFYFEQIVLCCSGAVYKTLSKIKGLRTNITFDMNGLYICKQTAFC